MLIQPLSLCATIPLQVVSEGAAEARAAALESLVMDASPHETTRQLVRLCEVRGGREGGGGKGSSGTVGIAVSLEGLLITLI